MQSLYNLTENLLAIYDALEENGGELTDELAAALDETDQAIALKADHYASFIRMIRDRAAAADAEIKRLQGIKRVAQNAEKAIRGHIADYMAATGRDRLEGERCKISLSRRKGLDVDEDAALAPYLEDIGEFAATLPDYVKVTASISKTAIKEADFPEGVLPAGVAAVETQSITIR